MRSLGETEFVAGVAAMSESGKYGAARACAGIIGNVDLRVGSRAKGILEQHITLSGGRFRGIRNGATWHADPSLRISARGSGEGLYCDREFARRVCRRWRRSASAFEAWMFHTQLGDLVDLARAFPQTTIVLNHIGGALAIGPYADKREEVFAEWRRQIRKLAAIPNVYIKLGGLGMPLIGFEMLRERQAALLGAAGEGVAPLYRDLHRGLRPAPLDVREQFPGRQGHVQLPGAVERLQAHRRRLLGRRENRAVQRRGQKGYRIAGMRAFVLGGTDNCAGPVVTRFRLPLDRPGSPQCKLRDVPCLQTRFGAGLRACELLKVPRLACGGFCSGPITRAARRRPLQYNRRLGRRRRRRPAVSLLRVIDDYCLANGDLRRFRSRSANSIGAKGETVVLQVHAEGAQIYECKAAQSGGNRAGNFASQSRRFSRWARPSACTMPVQHGKLRIA